VVAVAEVFRRAQWNLFRVEYEHINNVKKAKAVDIKVPVAE
jgi:hypothetical protein